MANDEVIHEPAAEKPASTPAEAAKDGDGLATIMASLKMIEERLGKLEGGEAREEAKVPSIHDNAMPSEPLPVQGQPAPTAADGDLKARIDALESKMASPVADAQEESKMAEHQAKADAVYAAWGKSAPRPLAGESRRAYRVRLLKDLQPHSPDYKEVDLNLIKDKSAFKLAEGAILRHAMDAASSPSSVPTGTLREVKKDYGTGRLVTEFVGDFNVAFGDFKAPKRLLQKINK